MAMSEFSYHGVPLDYETSPYNSSRLNERAVEVPIARNFVLAQEARGGPVEDRGATGFRGLEVGNVLAHYGVTGHTVVDAYEEGEGVHALDVFGIQATYDYIVSVSTIEHIRWDDPDHPLDPDGAAAALVHLRRLLRPEGRLLVTIPIGWHPRLDGLIRDGALGTTWEALYRRDGDGWVEDDPRTCSPSYGATTPWAEAVYVAEWWA